MQGSKLVKQINIKNSNAYRLKNGTLKPNKESCCNMYIYEENCVLMAVDFSHLYHQITPSKYANNQPKRCALISGVSVQNLGASLGLVQELWLVVYLGQVNPNGCRLGFVTESKLFGERGRPIQGRLLSMRQTKSKQENFQKIKICISQGNDFISPMQKIYDQCIYYWVNGVK